MRPAFVLGARAKALDVGLVAREVIVQRGTQHPAPDAVHDVSRGLGRTVHAVEKGFGEGHRLVGAKAAYVEGVVGGTDAPRLGMLARNLGFARRRRLAALEPAEIGEVGCGPLGSPGEPACRFGIVIESPAQQPHAIRERAGAASEPSAARSPRMRGPSLSLTLSGPQIENLHTWRRVDIVRAVVGRPRKLAFA